LPDVSNKHKKTPPVIKERSKITSGALPNKHPVE
tara:strand:+ start:98 stop:199 length:102 start_codon:yes stop_codon:yes gene_type:complete